MGGVREVCAAVPRVIGLPRLDAYPNTASVNVLVPAFISRNMCIGIFLVFCVGVGGNTAFTGLGKGDAAGAAEVAAAPVARPLSFHLAFPQGIHVMPDEAALAFSTAGGAVLGGASRRVEAPILQRVPVDAWAFACWVSRPAIRCCWSLTVVLLPAISSSWSAGESVVSEAAAVRLIP